ncbi:MAG: hypothetical protein N2246_00175 [Candidatus Sumerlaeia bacterium]|nr:hypothetical protein [Candidatus Sumerlaeia bacterium]
MNGLPLTPPELRQGLLLGGYVFASSGGFNGLFGTRFQSMGEKCPT